MNLILYITETIAESYNIRQQFGLRLHSQAFIPECKVDLITFIVTYFGCLLYHLLLRESIIGCLVSEAFLFMQSIEYVRHGASMMNARWQTDKNFHTGQLANITKWSAKIN